MALECDVNGFAIERPHKKWKWNSIEIVILLVYLITLVGDICTHSLGLRVSQRAAPSLALAVATSLDSIGLKTTPWKAELHTASSTGSEIKKLH